MSTIGEIVQSVLDVAVGNYTNYGHKPAVLIIGKDNIDRFPPGRGILIKEKLENPEFTLNRVKIFTKEFCDVRILEHSSSEREALMTDIEELFEKASYNIIYTNIRRSNAMNLFLVNMEVRLLN